MTVRRVVVTAPSRLHFGLYGFGHVAARQFGGIGAMVESPSLRLTASASDQFSASGPLAERVSAFVQRWTEFSRAAGMLRASGELPQAAIEVLTAPAEHSGLGVGTQLGLSVAAALNGLYDLPPVTPAELAQSVGRAQRSAVGTYGFMHGGLIAERGKFPSEMVSPLDARVALPDAWRFVLVTPRITTGLAGQAEIQAFEQLPPVPRATTDELVRLAREELLPAALQGEFVRFSAALDRYCHVAGLCFAAIQGGAYNGPELARLVEIMRSCGASGIGQSSWGPTLFAVFPDNDAATQFVASLRAAALGRDSDIFSTPPNNVGARIVIESV
jgi:beta-RFAP synthase